MRRQITNAPSGPAASAALAGAGVALAAGPLGAFVIWRRMAYVGDATAHAAILGVAVAFAFDISVYAGTLTVAAAMAISVARLSARGHSMDAALGVLSHSALALGLVAVAFLPTVRVSLSAWLFGDILAVAVRDVAVIWAGATVTVGIMIWRWSRLLTATLSSELAASAGIDPRREELVLTVLIALFVAVAMKVVGALLISAMLIIPAASARAASHTPESMAVISGFLALVSVGLGLFASLEFDTPAGPSIVSAAAGIFAMAFIARSLGLASRSTAQ